MVNQVGFLEYARSIFLEKDLLKTKLLISSEIQFPQLFYDEKGFVSILPEPRIKENEDEENIISLMGYHFPNDTQGKRQLLSLFRTTVFHHSAHAVSSTFEDYEEWRRDKDSRLARFITFLIEDVKVNSYISTKHPDKLVDLAFANTLALKRLHQINNLINPATKIMAGLLIKINTGLTQVTSKKEHEIITHLVELLNKFKEKASLSFAGENANLKDEKLKIADEIYYAVENAGPITEVPFLPYTEKLGACSIFFPSYFVNSDFFLEENFKKCLEFLGGSLPSSGKMEHTWKKVAEAEADQVFDSWMRQKEKDEKTIARYENFLLSTKFKSVEIPEQDYSEFLRIKSRCKSEAHRLIESLLVARNALDEDPRKMYGVLDLQEVIQVIASKSPRMDVFMLDENISKSYSWIILLDASRSMRPIRDFALELFVMLAEAANELLLDPTSWGMYAFNDRFFIVKDPKERYNVKVKARIGGIKFKGFTYMPDALKVAQQIIGARNENLKLITIISDGWPCGYPNINAFLSEASNTLESGNITVVGIGAKSRQMEFLFRNHSTVYTLRELAKKFSNLYLEASRIAVET